MLTRDLGARAAAPIEVTVNGEASQVAPGRRRAERRLRGQRRRGRGWPELRPAPDHPGADRRFGDQGDRGRRRGQAGGAPSAVWPRRSTRSRRTRRWRTTARRSTRPRRSPGSRWTSRRPPRPSRTASWWPRAPIELPAEVVEPEVTDDEADQVRENVAEPAVSAPIKVKAGRAGTFTISPIMIAESLTFTAENSTLVPVLDAGKLRSNAEPAVKKVELVKPKDATVRLVNGRPQVVAGGQRHRRRRRRPEEVGRAGAHREGRRAHRVGRADRRQGQVLHRGRAQARASRR